MKRLPWVIGTLTIILLAVLSFAACKVVILSSNEASWSRDVHGTGTSITTDSQGAEVAPPKSAPSNAVSPDGVAMPVGDLAGWKQVFTEDFTSGEVPIGAFPGPAYDAKWSANYLDGTPDTAGQMYESKSGYYPSKVLSVHDGLLDMYLHSENGVAMGAAPAPKLGENQPRPFNGQLYGRYSVRFRADAPKGFKTAWLLWPDSGQWPLDGEVDYPEGDLAGNFFAAMHGTGASNNILSVFETGSSYSSWHTATTEWSPGRVEFFLDGRSVGVTRTAVPTTSMHYVLQTEACLPTCPLPGASGHVYIDWVAVWAKK